MLDFLTLRALEAIEGCDYNAACRVLTETGYQKIGKGTGESTVFRYPASESVLRLFRHEKIPRAMADIGRKMPDNPFLPRIDECRSLSPFAHALVMEALIHPDELDGMLDKGAFKAVTGVMRAYRNFPLGDTRHRECHKTFNRSTRNQSLGFMLHALAREITDRYDDEPTQCLRLNNRTSSRVLLRRMGPAFFPVFADPLTLDNDRMIAMTEINIMLQRCEQLLQQQSPPAPLQQNPAAIQPYAYSKTA